MLLTNKFSENKNPVGVDARRNLIYYYHLDYLGTSNFITDGGGLVYEFFLNLPFGETMAEQHSQTANYVNKWKFTGHELDRETGLYYAKARYYDPKFSVFLSVDPMLEKYPSWSPYNYALNNPINLVDPTGMEAEDPPLGMPREHGTFYSDNTGSWKYDKPSDTWKGQNGSPDIDNAQNIQTVEITRNKSSNTLSNITWTLNLGATGLQNTPGSFRLGTSKQGFNPKYYENAWRGNQYAKTFNVRNIGTFASRGLTLTGIGIDGYKWYNGDISGSKFGLNTSMGLYGFTGIGTIPAIFYFGMEAFYPGGLEGAMNDNARYQKEVDAIMNTGNNGTHFYILPRGAQKL